MSNQACSNLAPLTLLRLPEQNGRNFADNFRNAYIENDMFACYQSFFPKGPIEVNIGSGNDLKRRQAITWTNDDNPDHWCVYVSPVALFTNMV